MTELEKYKLMAQYLAIKLTDYAVDAAPVSATEFIKFDVEKGILI